MSSASIEPLAEEEARRHAVVVRELVREVGHLSPALRDDRLVRRFAETRGFSRPETKELLLQYATYRVERGLDDDSLPLEAGVTAEMRKRHTMRLLDPRHAPEERRATGVGSGTRAEQHRALTFLALSTPSVWPTARDRDGCPVIYTNVEQYARGASKALEATLVWTCELAAESARVEKEKAEAAEFDKWKDMFTVTNEGTVEEEMAEESGGLLAEFVDYIAEKKVVVLEELAAEFGLRTQDAVSRVQALEQMGRITGVMDDRGKFIFISRDEMAEVAAFINRKGRVAIAELARKSSDFVKL